MGSSRPRNSTRTKGGRSVKPSPGAAPKGVFKYAEAGKPKPSSATRRSAISAAADPRIPVSIELAIGDQRDSLLTAISVLYCLHSTLRHEATDAGPFEAEEVDDAVEWADLTDLTAMLLVRLHAVHLALDSTELVQAKVDPDMERLAESARKLIDGDERRQSGDAS